MQDIKSPLVRKMLDTNQYSIHEIFNIPGRIYSFLNPVSYLTAVENVELMTAMDGLFADGNLMVKAVKQVYGKELHRYSFDMTSMAKHLFDFANEYHKSICVVATRQEPLELAISSFKKQYPNIVWVGCRNGYFVDSQEMEVEAAKIAQQNADFLVVGMGIKMQENFLLLCKKAGYKGIGFTCGGFIHQTAMQGGKLDYYPKWVDKYDLRFVYRMYKEPYTIKRYAKSAILFPFYFWKEKYICPKS